MRKIVQISTRSFREDTVGSGFRLWDIVTALCNDGTVWEHAFTYGQTAQWTRLPDIPQDYESTPEAL